MEASYTPGDGTVVGAGSRWLLLGSDPGVEAAEALWTLLTGPRTETAVVLDAVAQACGGDADLVLVDLTVGAETSVTRGSGRHTTLDGVHTLDLGEVVDVPVVRRLVGGVVAASRLVLRSAAPAAPRPTDVPAPRADDLTMAPTAGLIDGIPPDILAAAAPPPPPSVSVVAVQTDEPPPEALRMVERMGSTVRRDLGRPPALEPGGDVDHDGHTTYRPAGQSPPRPPPASSSAQAPAPSHLSQATNETVLAVHCPAGHVTAAYSPRCRVCHEPVPAQEPHRMPRPRLGTLHLPDGERVPLDRGVVFGRQPSAVPGGAEWPHLVRMPPEATYVSRSHLSVVLDGWLVIATDLGSRGGTTLRVAGRPPQRIRGHEQYVWEPGQVLDLADSYEIVYEVAE